MKKLRKKKYTIEEVRQIVNEYGYELITNEYTHNKQKLTIKDKEGYLYWIDFHHFQRSMLQEWTLNNFDTRNPYTIHNINLWCHINNKPFILVSDIYKGKGNKLSWRCFICKDEFEAPWSHINPNGGCAICHGKQLGQSNCLAIRYPQVALEWHPTKNGVLTPHDITYASSQYIWWKCKECGHEWETKASNRTCNGRNCPECNESKGERKVKEVLSLFDTPHDNQYVFDNLIGLGGGSLRFDVSVFWDEEKTRLRLLIEYDGEFHFRKCYKEQNFETQKKHDAMKNVFCITHNILLVRIPYWEFDNIESILKDILIHNNFGSKFIINNRINDI